MTVVGLHPEELFDKLLDGELTPAERERLQQHLDGCSVCRFEHAARLDFQAEALELAISSPLPALPLRAPLPLSEPVATPASSARRRRSRRLVWGLAAAALITASGAVASSMMSTPSWHPFGLLLTERARPAVQPVAVKKAPTLAAPKSVEAPSGAAAEALSTPSLPAVLVAAATNVAPAQPMRAAKPRPRTAEQTAAVVGAPTVLAGATPTHSETPSAKDAAAKDAAPAKEPTSAAKLFGEANQARRSGDIGRASGLYHLLQDQFPGSPEADLSRVTLAMLLLDSGDAQGALSGFERYLAGSSRGLEAEALVGRARALGRLGRRNLETAAWQEVQRKYPRSIYGRQASERLLALGQP